MRFIVYDQGGARPEPGVALDDSVIPLAELWGEVVGADIPMTWPDAFSVLFKKRESFTDAVNDLPDSRDRLRLDAVNLRAPVLAPGKILCIGLNYTDHVAEVGLDEPQRPHVFSKLRTALNGPTGDVRVPWEVTADIDYEAELAIVIGQACKDVSEGEALENVLGYTVANDMSARDWQFADDGQLTLGKGFDGFLPLGPWIISTDELDDPSSLRIRCWVDDELRQDASTGQMVAGPARIISFLSQVCTLEPGDLIATGTPAGVGYGHKPQRFMRKGQTITTEIEGIGSLRNKVL